tara:strand:- start:815 stop:1228 length:414 start_codon:yes stop_codon:yes gene_type:complete
MVKRKLLKIIMTRESLCLLLIAPGVLAVSLSYGLYPEITLRYLYNIEVNSTNLANIFRAIMGLYIALSIFWVAGAFKKSLRLAALWSMTIFMTGIALGRILSIIIDGFPYPIFLFYTVIEIFSALIGFYLIKNITIK